MGFIFNQNAGETPETLAQKRKIAEALLQQGMDTSPIQSWTQGAARIAQALSGNWARARADREESKGREAAASGFNSILSAIYPDSAAPSGAAASGGVAPKPAAPPNSFSTAQFGNGDLKMGIEATAKSLGINPMDLATAISYETAGTFDPTKTGPTTQWGRHRGLIQFGEPQAKQYGVDWSNPVGSQLGPNGAVAKYLKDAGVQPGMGLMDVYSAINAGHVGKYNASDANNGGAPGTVADKVNTQMAGHRTNAERLLGGGAAPGNASGGATVQPAGYSPAAAQQAGQMPMGKIFELMSNPYLSEAQQGILATVIKQKMATGEWTKLNDGTMFNNLTGETQKVEVPRGPMAVSQGQTIFDPNTQQPMFSVPAAEKGNEKPAAIQEYEYAKEQGFPGSFQDWEASKKGGMSLQTNPDGTVSFSQGSNIKPMTEAQSKDTVFATRAEGALRIFDQIENGLTGKQGVIGGTLGQLPVAGNYLKTEDFQRAEQAGNEFLQAILRKDTGAAITPGEQALYGTVYLPRPGDSPKVMEQKKAARKRALNGIKAGMPPQAILAQETALAKESPQQSDAMSQGPQPDTVEDGYRFKGGDPADPNNWEPVQ